MNESKEKIKILEAFGEPIMAGGQESFVFGVMDKLDMTGLMIDCLTAYDWQVENYKELVQAKEGHCFSFKLPFIPGKSRKNIKKPLEEFLKNYHYDVIHIHSGSISVLAIMAEVADQAGVKKVIVHSHATGQGNNLKHKVLRFVASLSMGQHVDIYCACSKEAADWKYEKKYADKALIIKNGIDTDRFFFNPPKREEMRRTLKIQEQAFVIGHVGRFSWEKNHKFLIEVFEKISKREREALLLLVGDGDEMANVQEQVKSKGLENKVIFTGSVQNVEDYLQAMDVFVVPSLYEGLGIVAIEAQSTGLPIVASTCFPIGVAITDNLVFLDLSEGKEKWVDKVISFKNILRHDNKEEIISAGYSIEQTAKSVREIYEK